MKMMINNNNMGYSNSNGNGNMGYSNVNGNVNMQSKGKRSLLV